MKKIRIKDPVARYFMSVVVVLAMIATVIAVPYGINSLGEFVAAYLSIELRDGIIGTLQSFAVGCLSIITTMFIGFVVYAAGDILVELANLFVALVKGVEKVLFIS